MAKLQSQADCNLLWMQYKNALLEKQIAELEGRYARSPIEPECSGYAGNSTDLLMQAMNGNMQILSLTSLAKYERKYAASRKYQTEYFGLRWGFLTGTEPKKKQAEFVFDQETAARNANAVNPTSEREAAENRAKEPTQPQQKPDQPAPIINGSAQQVTTISESVKERVIQHSRSCPLTHEWSVDFAGNGSPYRVEQRHCSNQQLSAFDLPKSDWTDLRAGYSFLLVLKPPLNELVHGEFEEGSYSSVEPIKVQGREYVAVNGMVWGPSGDHYWCLLAQDRTGQFACWRKQKGDLRDYLRTSLQPDERLTAMDSIAGKDGRVFIESYVEVEGDAQCCPSRGKIQVDLTPKDGVLYWSKVTRIACPGVATGTGTCSDSAAR